MDLPPDQTIEPQAPTSPKGPLKTAFQDVVNLLTEPTSFFRERYPQISFSYALALGVGVQWIASVLDWITRTIRHETLFDGLKRIREKLEVLPFWKNLPENIWAQGPDTTNLFPAWLAEMFGVIVSPFQSLLEFCISGIMLFIGAYLLIQKKENQDPVDLGPLVKLSALTSAPYLVSSILGFVPFGLSKGIGWIYSLALLLIGLNIRYHISYLRGFAILCVPTILAIFAVSCLIGGLIAIFAALGAALFGTM